MDKEGTVCGKLKEESGLKRCSIHILPNDTDTDFDFYVLIDESESREKNGFLKELFNFLDDASDINYANFADNNHKGELKKWLNTEDNEDLTVLNWLKVVIEKYPYRLFVAVDNVDSYKEKSKKAEFLKKRICWINKKELMDILNGNSYVFKNLPENINIEDKAKLWLYCKWIKHISLNVAGVTIGSIKFEKMRGRATSCKSETLPPVFDSDNLQNRLDAEVRVWCSVPMNGSGSEDIGFGRHEIPKGPNYHYVEGLSGSQFFYPMIMDFYRKASLGLKDYDYYLIQNIIIEAALLRYFIVDERVSNFNNENPKSFLGKGIEVGLEIYSENNSKDDSTKNSPSNSDSPVLIIHQGIIDEKKYTDKQFLSLKDKHPFFVITSGRGKPFNLSPVGKFLPFSVLETYLMKDYPEKILFNFLLMKLQRRVEWKVVKGGV